jgi:hypothetical protein
LDVRAIKPCLPQSHKEKRVTKNNEKAILCDSVVKD